MAVEATIRTFVLENKMQFKRDYIHKKEEERNTHYSYVVCVYARSLHRDNMVLEILLLLL